MPALRPAARGHGGTLCLWGPSGAHEAAGGGPLSPPDESSAVWVTSGDQRESRARTRGVRRPALPLVDNSGRPGDNLGTLGTAGHSEHSRLTASVGGLSYRVRMPGQDAPEARPLRPIEVQRLLHVGRTTVHDYAARGLLVVDTTTPGGHRRYRADSPALEGRPA